MLARFSLYGFLKNQRYFEPFFILALREKNFSFAAIGLLFSFKYFLVNLLEIPSGAVADTFGRRKSVAICFLAYAASFFVFARAENLEWFYLAMGFFAIGEAFRTGTHKALIFSWLELHDRGAERTKVYGYTRSWSKIGSALSVLIGGGIILAGYSYSTVFYLSIIPCLLGIINVLSYPANIDTPHKKRSVRGTVKHLGEAIRLMLKTPALRGLVAETMGMGGVFQVVKEFLQPILKVAALILLADVAFATELTPAARAAVLIIPVYFVLHLLSAVASRKAHKMVKKHETELAASTVIWGLVVMVYTLMFGASYLVRPYIAGVAFVILIILQNIWRPILMARFHAHTPSHSYATTLSVESQARGVTSMLLAPIVGMAVDYITKNGPGGGFWPVAVLGIISSLIFFVSALLTRKQLEANQQDVMQQKRET